uniref:Uncharacterized protein n=1 Tax=Helianthus annuus TaxID=4232 RepID=A0A251V391_HELAN
MCRNKYKYDFPPTYKYDFPPTYKYEFNLDRYASENAKEGEKRRAPTCSVFVIEVEFFDSRKLRRALNLTSATVHSVIMLGEADLELLA